MSLSEAKQKLLAQRLAGKASSSAPKVLSIPLRPDAEEKLLAPVQQRLWYQFQVDPDSPSYNITSSYLVRGSLDLTLIGTAANRILSRHTVLKSRFRPEGATAVQEIDSDFHLEVERIVIGHPDDATETAQKFAAQPFDLTMRPPIRILYFSTDSSADGLLMLLVHHIVFDEWSLGIFWKEFAAIYRGLSGEAGQAQLPELPVQYSDFAHWQREQQEEDACDEQLNYWVEHLRPLPPPLELPVDHVRPFDLTDAGAVEVLRLDQPLTVSIRDLARAAGVSHFVVFLSGFAILLHRYSDKKEIVIGSPVANRRAPELADLIGFFLSTVALKISMSDNASVADILGQIQESTIAAFDHLDVPFEKIVNALRPARVHGQSPLFQTMFVYEGGEHSSVEMELPGVNLELSLIDARAAKFDLTLFMMETADSLDAVFEYRTDLFEPSTIRRMLAHLQQVLAGMTRNPNASVSEIKLLTDEEEETIRETWQGQTMPPAEASVIQQFVKCASATPEALAVVDRAQRLTYAEVLKRAQALAQMLRSRGIDEGSYVILFLSRSAEAIVGILGIHLAGAAYVPVDPTYPKHRQQRMLQDSGAVAVVTSLALKTQLGETPAAVVCVDDLATQSKEADSTRGTMKTPAYVIYTSGSTGEPKGVVITQENLAWSTAARDAFYPEPPARFLLIPSLSFDSSIAGIFWALTSGGVLVLMPDKLEQDMDALVNLISREKVTHLLCLPSIYEFILEFGDMDRLQTLSTVMVAGEACSTQLSRKHTDALPEVALVNEYGPTEATVWCVAHKVTERAGPIPIGRPIPGATVYLLDARGQLVPPGLTGEIYVGGPGIAAGYLSRPDLTNERFIADPFNRVSSGARLYRTGDLGRYREDGTILFLGRVDGQVKVRGHRIELGEIEATLRQHSAVGDVVVAPRPDVSIRVLLETMQELDPDVAERMLAEIENS